MNPPRSLRAALVALIVAGPLCAQGTQVTGARIPGRIIGVFDDATGQPLVGAQVEDLFTGMVATTTATGTVSLFYVDTTGTMVRVKKVGYVPQIMTVRNSPSDTIPVTVVLKPAVPLLPTVTTTAKRLRGPADTVRKLESVGFYDRLHESNAPTRAFVTEKVIGKVRLLSDLWMQTGRSICANNLYLDGVLVDIPDLNFGGTRTTPLLRNGIDALIEPSQVVGIELYDVADVPARFNRTIAEGKVPCGATLIWTR